ncbi:MAG: universal stress protein [Rhodopila sp.]|nr:universal stress protein [Rhodopila sp.]
MPEVILVVSGHPSRREHLAAAARRLGMLSGQGRVRMLALPATGPAPDKPGEQLPLGADVAAAVEAQGSRADFIVIARPTPEDDHVTREAFRAALFRTERPLLMVPPDGPADTFGVRVAVAWRDDPRTLKALVPALRLLGDTEEVLLLAGVRAGAASPTIPSVLVEHGVPTSLHVLAIDSSPFGDLLLGRARELGADMLIMGAYARSLLREMLLGGVTRHVLAHADLPVLLRY